MAESRPGSRPRDGGPRRFYHTVITPQDSVLEVGCGSGDLLQTLPGRDKVGVDHRSLLIERAKRQFPHLEFHVMPPDHLRLERQFDVVIVSYGLEVLEDVQQAFQGLLTVCHPHTTVVIPYTRPFWKPLFTMLELIGWATPQHNRLSQKAVTQLLSLAGLQVDPSLGATRFTRFRYLLARRSPETTDDRTEWAKRYSVSVILPVKNECRNLEQALLRIPPVGRFTELIFIEGHSTDGTWEKLHALAEQYQASRRIVVAKQKGRGKADAVREGFEMASGDIVMILDGDLTVPPESLPKFYEAIASGKGEFILGSRLVYPIPRGAMGLFSWLGNGFFSALLSWLVRQPIGDALCGTKVLFRSDYLKLRHKILFGRLDSFGDFDLILGAHALGLEVLEIPIRYQARSYGRTSLPRVKHGFALLILCLLQLKDRLLLKDDSTSTRRFNPANPSRFPS